MVTFTQTRQDYDLELVKSSDDCWFVNMILNQGKGPNLNLFQVFDEHKATEHYEYMLKDRIQTAGIGACLYTGNHEPDLA